MRDTIHRVAGALSEGRPDAVLRAIQNSFLVRRSTRRPVCAMRRPCWDARGRAVRLGLGPVCACRLGSRVLQLSVTSRPCVMHDPAQSMASLFLLRCESSLRMCAGSQVCSGCTSMPSCVQTLPGWRGDAPRRRPAGAQVSADMAHALHPNYTDRHEPGHKPAFGGGLVLKHNANQRYATNAVSATLFRRGPRTPLSFALLTP